MFDAGSWVARDCAQQQRAPAGVGDVDMAAGDDVCGGEDDGERLLHAVAGMSCDGLKPRSSSIDAAAEPAAKRTKMK